MSLLAEQSFESHSIHPEQLPNASESAFVQGFKLEKGGSATLVTDKVFIDKNDPFLDEVERLVGERASVVGMVGLPLKVGSEEGRSDQFFIIDTHNSRTFNTPFALLKEENGKGVVKGIWPNKPAVVGRSSEHANKFQHSNLVSGSHFSIKMTSNGLLVKDLNSMNGTSITGFMIEEGIARESTIGRRFVKDHFTAGLMERARRLAGFDEQSKHEAPYGTLKGYAIIGRDSPSVRGGVYGTIRPDSEFVIVNDMSPQIKKIEQALLEIIFRSDAEKIQVTEILNQVCILTAHHMKYDLEKVDAMSSPLAKSQGLIALSDYIDAGVGVCRQQALLAAVLIEKLTDEGVLSGSTHVERNHDTEAHGAHAWAVYTEEGKNDYIVDPAQHFVGTREQAAEQGRWRYYVDVSQSAR